MQEKKAYKRLDIGMSARIKQVSYPHLVPDLSLTRISRIIGGLLLASTLLIPVLWIPGLVILILPIEVYLLDWVHSQFSKSHVKRSLFGKSSGSEVYSDAGRRRVALSLSESEKKRLALRVLRQPPFVR